MKRPSFLLTTATSLLLLVTGGAYAQHGDTPRFEVGAQFTLLTLSRPRPLFDCCIIVSGNEFDPIKKYGFGARFAYHLTNSIALEAESNFFPERGTGLFDQIHAVPAGKVFQGQFGVKAGKSFKRFGLFGKARPGFVSFTEVSQLVSKRTITFMNQQFTIGEFRVGKEAYFSMDVGGVVEFYPTRRTVIRMDAGDTIIRYGTFRVQGFSLSGAILERPPETKHNFQFSAGFGFRF
jgi:hypothetical protein